MFIRLYLVLTKSSSGLSWYHTPSIRCQLMVVAFSVMVVLNFAAYADFPEVKADRLSRQRLWPNGEIKEATSWALSAVGQPTKTNRDRTYRLGGNCFFMWKLFGYWLLTRVSRVTSKSQSHLWINSHITISSHCLLISRPATVSSLTHYYFCHSYVTGVQEHFSS